MQFNNDGELFITSDSKTDIKLDLFEQCFLDLFKTLDKTKKHSFSFYNLFGCNQVNYHGVFEITFSDPNNPTSDIIGVLHKNPSFTEKLNMLNQEVNALRIRKNFEDELNAQDYHGNTALHHAVDKGDFDLVETLVEKGADFNVQNEEGDTTLHLAFLLTEENEKVEIAEFLINKGADLNLQSIFGHTALHLAAMFWETELAKLLIKKGADTTLKNKKSKTPLQIAIHEECYEIAELLKKIKLNEL